MLNDRQGGTLPAAWTADADYASCYSCHTTLYAEKRIGASYPSGREDCRNCHDVPAAHGQRRKRGQ